MCQLLGMNCNVPTDIVFSFTGFQARGGLTDVHKDGWGIAFFEDKGVRQFLDHQPSSTSPVAALVKAYPIQSKNVIAHIRKATQGAVSLVNTHPFQRELWGSYWVFAHNGHLPNFQPTLTGAYAPVGSTDSERAFCWILQELRREHGESAPNNEALFESLRRLATEVGSQGEFNFLLSNGEVLVAHCSTQLASIIRQAPFSKARLRDQDVTVDFRAVTTESDRVAVIATVPLTADEVWTLLSPGSLLVFQDGTVIYQGTTVPGVKRVVAP